MPTDPTRDVASDEALLAESYAAGCDECGRHPALKPRLHSLACRLATRLREVLAERDLLAQERIDARIDYLLHQKDRERLVAAQAERDAKDAEIARLKAQSRYEVVQVLAAERDALKAQLAEAREKALDEAERVAFDLDTSRFDDEGATYIQRTRFVFAIRALKSGERVQADSE